MQPFIHHTGEAAPLDRPNVDTDAIIPKQFLKRIERSGFGEFLFYDWRYRPDGSLNEDFVLNREPYTRASILLAGRNFGCGSSREHAVWALYDFGIRAIIAPSFADIFHSNCLGNGLLPITLPEEQVSTLMEHSQNGIGHSVTIDLEAQTIEDDRGFTASFEIDPFSRHRLLNGLDDIGLTLQHSDAIDRYERMREPATR